MKFSADTAVTASGDHFTAEIRPGWDVRGNANGGYRMALGARAMAAASRPHPVAVTAHFLSPGRVGEVTITPSLVKAGRTFNTLRATLAGPDRPLLELPLLRPGPWCTSCPPPASGLMPSAAMPATRSR